MGALLCVIDICAALPLIYKIRSNGTIKAFLQLDEYIVPASKSMLQEIGMLKFTYENETWMKHKAFKQIPRGKRMRKRLLHYIAPRKNNDSAGIFTRLFVYRLAERQKPLLQNLFYISNVFNPSIVSWRGRLLMACRIVVDHRQQRHFSENHILFAWLNHSSAPFYSNDTYEGITPHLSSLQRYLPGQDARLTVISNTRIVATFTASAVNGIFSGKYMRSGKAELLFNPNNTQIELQNNRSLVPIRYTVRNRHEKNWTPFVYQGKMRWVVTIDPMFVVRPGKLQATEGLGAMRQHVEIVSNETASRIPWVYGAPRGGTNAIHLQGKYIAIFHSHYSVPDSPRYTYFMGAFTFSDEPPFRLLEVSRLPIVDLLLYSGPTFHKYRKKARSDYVIFPMSLFEGDAEYFMLSLGTQDRHGWLASINKQQLLDSLEPVQ